MQPATDPSPPPRSVSNEDILKIFSSRTNRSILSLLSVEPTYPRKIGNLLTLSEAEVARRLKQMEGLGLVSSSWSFIGKNIKLYTLITDRVVLKFNPQGLQVDVVKGNGGQGQTFTVAPFSANIPSVDEFVGRSEELALLGGSDRVILVEGLPGIGKTSLVARYARGLPSTQPVFWHSFRGLESLNWLANRFAVFLAQHGSRDLLVAVEQGLDVADKRDLLLQSLDNERFVIVLDDVQRAEDQAVRDLITDAAERLQKAKLILSAREAPRFNQTAPGRRVLRLGGLADADVAQFFKDRNVNVLPALLPKVREEVGGHPMALNLFLDAAHELKVPVEKLLDRIPERQVEDYLLQEVYQRLTDDDKQALTLASLFRAGFSAEDLNGLSKKSHDHVLLRLRRRGLLQFDGTEFSLHEIIRNFFYKLLKDKEALHARAAAHYLALDSIQGRLEAMHHYSLAGKRDQVLHLLEEDLDLQQFDVIDAGYQNLYLTVLNQFARADVTDPRRWALIQDERGDILLSRRAAADALAHYAEAWEHFSKAKDKERLADLAWKRGLALVQLGRAQEAKPIVADALKGIKDDGLARKRLQQLATQLDGNASKARRVKAPT